MNLKLSGIVAAAGFILSLLIGVFSGGAPDISLLRAVSFGMVFFILAGVIWLSIHRFLPELFVPPEEEPLMTGLETGSRVNISVGDDDVPANAALPTEEDSRGDLGNVAELTARKAPVQDETPGSMPLPDLNGAAAKGSPAGSPVLDLGAEEGYSKNRASAPPEEKKRNGMPAASNPAAPAEESGVVFTPLPPPLPLQNFSGADLGSGIETLPDLDAMAGAFMSSDEEDGEETAASLSMFGAEPKPRGSGKAKSREDDYNPKEVASAIQTLLKRD
ncbi:MAG: hypothetical protein LBT87_09280 [Treponema sp.]|jgi:hypothetical protein|nr:hypothetical protein [Treponema sp.]